MFFADKPYISDLFKATVKDNAIPVVNTASAKELALYDGTTLISEEDAIKLVREQADPRIYTTSENAIGWIAEHLPFTDLPAKIKLFKDKVAFRELTKPLFPDFYFQAVRVDELTAVKFNDLPLPFIIKPAVGFFSMGVYKVNNLAEWENTIEAISAEMDQVKNLYPQEVLDTSTFIIEQCIEGEEFAIDAYFDGAGELVILNILRHTFASEADVSDRVYTTSKAIIEDNLTEFTTFIGEIGRLAAVKNFPVHVELRRGGDGVVLPIEVNPMRFGGWCTTADMAYFAYNFNPYLAYFHQQKPDWDTLLADKAGKLFSIIVLDNSTGLAADDIAAFDYDKLVAGFERPLILRKINYHQYPVFGFLFVETGEDNFAELQRILTSDLREFVTAQ